MRERESEGGEEERRRGGSEGTRDGDVGVDTRRR